jgi:hypothetical protein
VSERAARVRIYIDADIRGLGKIEALIDEPGPFIVRASRTTMTPISLD